MVHWHGSGACARQSLALLEEPAPWFYLSVGIGADENVDPPMVRPRWSTLADQVYVVCYSCLPRWTTKAPAR